MGGLASRIRFIASREVRVFSAGWEHPRDAAGDFVPLLANPDARSRQRSDRDHGIRDRAEGTPISPAFSNTREGRLDLVRWCADHSTTLGEHRAGAEAWAAILFGPNTTIGLDGTVET